jgi:hypothetical protein
VAFSLGLLLAQMLSGESVPSSSRDVFVRTASQDAEVCAALIELTSDDPARRLAMANSLFDASNEEPFDALPFLLAKRVGGTTHKVTEWKGRTGSPALVMRADALVAIELADLERLAARTGVPAAFLERLQSSGEPVVLAEYEGISQAKRQQRSLREDGFSTELWRDTTSTPSSWLRTTLGVVAFGSPGVAAMVYGGPAVGAAVGTLGLALGALVAGRSGRKGCPPRVWNPPPSLESAVELARGTRRRLVRGEVSAIGTVLLRQALDDLEDALVAEPQDSVRVDVAECSLRRTLGHALAAEEEASQVASPDRLGGES